VPNRRFGHRAVPMALAPHDPADPRTCPRAARAAPADIAAARNDNRGLRPDRVAGG
jgi:hypothetical protein